MLSARHGRSIWGVSTWRASATGYAYLYRTYVGLEKYQINIKSIYRSFSHGECRAREQRLWILSLVIARNIRNFHLSFSSHLLDVEISLSLEVPSDHLSSKTTRLQQHPLSIPRSVRFRSSFTFSFYPTLPPSRLVRRQAPNHNNGSQQGSVKERGTPHYFHVPRYALLAWVAWEQMGDSRGGGTPTPSRKSRLWRLPCESTGILTGLK